MLVLGRKRRESVVLGGEVVVAVEEILGGDGQRVFGATIRLGFQSPRSVSICRSELLARGSAGARTGGKRPRAPVRPGRLVEIPDAQVRLRIEVPPKIPVRCNGRPSVGVDVAESAGDAAQAPKQVHYVHCGKEDQITICHNIKVAPVDFVRFVFFDQWGQPPAPFRHGGEQGPRSSGPQDQLAPPQAGDQPPSAGDQEHRSGPGS